MILLKASCSYFFSPLDSKQEQHELEGLRKQFMQQYQARPLTQDELKASDSLGGVGVSGEDELAMSMLKNVIDEDDDVGKKTKVRTSIVGSRSLVMWVAVIHMCMCAHVTVTLVVCCSGHLIELVQPVPVPVPESLLFFTL
jgi:hypothetical protein